MRWFSHKPKPSEPKQAEPQTPASEPQPAEPPIPDEITLTVKCMKCDERFKVTFSRKVIRTSPGLCPRCQQVLDWMVQDERYLEFLRIETETTRRKWIVR
jgi:hypothetical protein